MKGKSIAAPVGVLLLLISVSTFPARGDGAKVKGMITSRTGDTLAVKSSNGEVTVVLTDQTRTKDNTGLFGLGRKEMSDAVLIPGLKVDVDGATDEQGRVVAKTITVDGDDLETAEMIQAGLHPTAEQVAANMRTLEAQQQKIGAHESQLASQNQSIEGHSASIATHEEKIQQNMQDIAETTNRFMALDDYDVKDQATVMFRSGSSTISAAGQAELKRLAEAAKPLTGYIVEVTGYADSVGGAEMNTRLSEKRAKTVVTFLMQQCGVPMIRIVAPGAMGEYGQAAPNETKAGRAENRRAEVKVLVNKGIAAGR
jgi:OOP family OmpA-OmpF porin